MNEWTREEASEGLLWFPQICEIKPKTNPKTHTHRDKYENKHNKKKKTYPRIY